MNHGFLEQNGLKRIAPFENGKNCGFRFHSYLGRRRTGMELPMKKLSSLTILVALILSLGIIGGACAEILPPYGEGQIGYLAAILCEKLTLRENPSVSSKVVKILEYGDFLIVVRQSDGWAYCTLGDSEDDLAGWVNADYIAIDPARYRTEAETPVYAWNDTKAPKIGLLDKDTILPILKEEGDWLLVSLRGAVGWIRK